MSEAAAAEEAQGYEATGVRHRWYENLIGLATGLFLSSLGVFFLHSAHAVTGGAAGLSLLVSYLVPLPIGVLFPLVNVPFFALALWKKGWQFTLRTFVCVTLVGIMADLHGLFVHLGSLQPVYGTIAGNLLAGVGLLILFRHGASLGGVNILALLLQERLGWNAGAVQMCCDIVIVGASFFVAGLPTMLVSALGAVVMNIVIAFNHRPGRYMGY
ncbi:YitT family protein [Brevibacterium sp. BRM-1]|uniref:YitT family protein n=1 Tax=Brevibacterium sp. BRM-1 TaxID=2999062 RepID=UPI00227FD4E5|nr:YitT family protein [Brevibacterium sp. BRM-1]WAL39942.1 YitT family protein [Brevibacterium sp. BRM-1]